MKLRIQNNVITIDPMKLLNSRSSLIFLIIIISTLLFYSFTMVVMSAWLSATPPNPDNVEKYASSFYLWMIILITLIFFWVYCVIRYIRLTRPKK